MKVGEWKKLLRASRRNLGVERAEVYQYISILEDEKKHLSYFNDDARLQY